MPLGDRIGRAADKAFGAEIKAEVVARHRQSPHHGFDESAPQRARSAQVVAGEAMSLQRRIAGEQLIAAVTTQRDLHMLARERRQQIGRNDRRVAQRLVEQHRKARDEPQQHRRFKRQLVVIGAEMRRHLARV